MKSWGVNIERMVSEACNAVLLRGSEMEHVRNAIVLLDQRIEALSSVGSRAVAELDAIMTAFRAEILQNKTKHKSEVLACGEALKSELRVLVEQLQLKFLEDGGTIRTLTATVAAAASTVPSRQDPWFRPGQPAPQDASRERTVRTFHVDADSDNGAAPFLGPPQLRIIVPAEATKP